MGGVLKKIFSRKFFACLFGVAIILLVYFGTLFKDSTAINPTVIITTILLIFLLVILYISSNAFVTFVKSRWFQADLVNK